MANEQTEFHGQGQRLSQDLAVFEGAAGRGNPGRCFAAGYDLAAEGTLEVWGASVGSIGGVAEGFTVTANNYVAVDHATNPHASGPAPSRPVPPLVHSANYPAPGSIEYGGGPGSDGADIQEILQEVDSAIDIVMSQVLAHFMSIGRIAEIMPLGRPSDLRELAAVWSSTDETAKGAGERFSGIIATITDPGNSEWQGAMQQFCRSIWGTSAWGHGIWGHGSTTSSGGRGMAANTTSQPILEVVEESATKIAACLEHMADAVTSVWNKIKEILKTAAKETAKEFLNNLLDDIETVFAGFAKVLAVFLSKIDTAALNEAIDAFEAAAQALGEEMKQLAPSLDEARASAPSFQAEDARAEAVGTRSLNDFRDDHQYTVPGSSQDDHKYPVDLTGQEGIAGSHTIDKHVGKTDDQLVQRLRDQPGIPASSSFTDLNEAQKDTQAALGNPANEEKIAKWLANPRRTNDSGLDLNVISVGHTAGHTVTKGAYAADPTAPQVQNAGSVKVYIQYRKGLHPPFVVLTSMPVLP